MDNFDWYISPADRFSRESEFSKVAKGEDAVTISGLEALFQVSRLPQSDFVQIWALVSLGQPTINQEQFVYFKHILDSRRKGKQLPIGVPLHIKEAFLKEKVESQVYTRTMLGTRDPGVSSTKDLSTIQAELKAVDEELRLAEDGRIRADDRLAELSVTKADFEGLAEYKRKQLSVVKDDAALLKDGQMHLTGSSSGNMASGAGGEFLAMLAKEKSFLETRRLEIQRALESTAADIARER